MIGFVIFVVGFSITTTYIFFWVFNKREEERNESQFSIKDNIDYDGH